MDKQYAINTLKKCSFYEEWKKNLYEKNKLTPEQFFDKYENDIYDWINYAFHWESSPQGKDYWEEISACWNDFSDYDDCGYLNEWYDADKNVSSETDEIDSSFHIQPRVRHQLNLNFQL